MKRILLVLICMLALVWNVSAAEAASTEVTGLNTTIELTENGAAAVTSQITVSFSGSDTRFVIPLGADASDCSASVPAETEEIDGITCLVLTSETGFSGVHTFTVSYALPCQVTSEDGVQLLNLAVLSPGYTCSISGLSFSVKFPAAFDTAPALVSGYHGDTAFNDFSIECTDGVYSASLLTKMQDHDSLTLTAELPDGYFDLRNMPGKTSSIDGYIFWGLAALCVIYWFFRLRNGILLPKSRKILPLNANPGEVGYQTTCDSPDLTSMVMQWANLGYLSIYRNRYGRIILRRQMDMGNERRNLERSVFDSLFRRDDVCDGQSLRYRTSAKNMRAPFRSYWSKRLFDRHSGSVVLLRIFGLLASYAVGFMTFDLILGAFSARWFLIPVLALLVSGLSYLIQRGVVCALRRRWKKPVILAFLAAFATLVLGRVAGCSLYTVLNVLLQIFIGVTSMFGGLRSRFGKDLLLQLLGFRKYLRSASKSDLLRSLQSDALYFYHTLPYAEAMGIGKRFAKRFGEIHMEPCAWLEDANGVPTTASEFYEVYLATASALRQEDEPNLLTVLVRSISSHRRRKKRKKAPRRVTANTAARMSAGEQPEPHVRAHRQQTAVYDPEDEFFDDSLY